MYTHTPKITTTDRSMCTQTNKEDLYAGHIVTRLQTAHQKFKTHTCSLRAVKEANSTWLFVVIYISRQTSPLESGLLYFATKKGQSIDASQQMHCQQRTNSSHAFAFVHQLRSVGGKNSAGRSKQTQGPNSSSKIHMKPFDLKQFGF